MTDLKKNYEDIKGEMHSKLIWCGENGHYTLFKGNRIQLTRNRNKYDVIVNGITSDVRLAMLAESFNMLAKKMEKENLLSIIPEPDTYSKITCQQCGQLNSKRIKEGKRCRVV